MYKRQEEADEEREENGEKTKHLFILLIWFLLHVTRIESAVYALSLIHILNAKNILLITAGTGALALASCSGPQEENLRMVPLTLSLIHI